MWVGVAPPDYGRSFRAVGRVVLYPERSATNHRLMLCTESCAQERFCGKVIPPKLTAADVA